MLPLAVILSTYMQLQIDVVIAKEDLSTKLLDSAYDGILSFEINSLSIDNVTGASIKGYVSSAVNTFFDTMSINMGASGGTKLDVQSYVPAILFTSYDGYYIYSPVKTSKAKINMTAATSGNMYENYGVASETPLDGEDDGIVHGNGRSSGGEVELEGASGSGSVTAVTGVGDNTKYDDSSSRTKISYNYMVKPFIYYSAHYVDNVTNNYDVVVNYSMDNHIALFAKYKSTDGNIRYATKSGYLIKIRDEGATKDRIQISNSSKFFVTGALNTLDVPAGTNPEEDFEIPYSSLNIDDWVTLFECKDANYHGQNSAGNKVVRNNEDKEVYEVDESRMGSFTKNGYEYIIRGRLYNLQQQPKVDKYSEMTTASVGYDKGGEAIIEYTLEREKKDGRTYVDLTVDGKKITDRDAKEYYLKAYFFSKWVYSELGPGPRSNSKVQLNKIDNIYINEQDGDVQWRTAQTLSGNQGIDESAEASKNDTYLFDIYQTDPEAEESIFNQHRRQVIQNSIQYNLNSAISTYNDLYKDTLDFSMPVLSANDWDNILDKVSFVVFMQGVPIGGSTWGDYAIATSTNNRLFVNKNNLLFINRSKLSDKESSYHKIDCLELINDIDTSNPNDPIGNLYGGMSYEFVYDAQAQDSYVYRLMESGKAAKYYKYRNNWYDWKGVKVVDAATLSNLNNPDKAKPLSSAYVGFGNESYNLKVLFYDDGSGNKNNYDYYQYSNVDDNGYLIPITGNPRNDPKKYTREDNNTGKPIYDYDYHEIASYKIDLYDHANVGCYWCMMGANYPQFSNFMDRNQSMDYRKKVYFRGSETSDDVDSDKFNRLDAAWLTYLAKYKNNLYKTTDSIQR